MNSSLKPALPLITSRGLFLGSLIDKKSMKKWTCWSSNSGNSSLMSLWCWTWVKNTIVMLMSPSTCQSKRSHPKYCKFIKIFSSIQLLYLSLTPEMNPRETVNVSPPVQKTCPLHIETLILLPVFYFLLIFNLWQKLNLVFMKGGNDPQRTECVSGCEHVWESTGTDSLLEPLVDVGGTAAFNLLTLL